MVLHRQREKGAWVDAERAVLWFLVSAFVALSACSGHPRRESDGGSDSEAHGDGDVDSDGDADGQLPDGAVPDSRECGNGVVDDGEECDDRNRLNGDGCDWLCQLGDGAPPPEPDPSFPPYEREGSRLPVEAGPPYLHGMADRLPLVWTGSELATVIRGEGPPGGDREIRFFRFDEHGATLDSDWVGRTVAMPSGLDLEWTGDGFALFYAEGWVGAFMMLLDRRGKPLAGPWQLVEDPCFSALAAGSMESGYVLSWGVMEYSDSETSGCRGDRPSPFAGTYIDLFAEDGSASGPPAPERLTAGHGDFPDVAVGTSGFGVAVSGAFGSPGRSEVAFFGVDEALGEVVPSGSLSRGSYPSVVFASGSYWVAWGHRELESSGDPRDVTELCVARFSAEGLLVAPPACSPLSGHNDIGWPSMAFGDGGLGMVVRADESVLFVRTDSSGVAVGRAIDVAGPDYAYGPYAVAWTGTAFAVLFSSAELEPLHLLRFVEAE